MIEEKLKGVRKAGIVVGTITGLIAKTPEDIRVTAGILLLAGLAVICQTILDKAKQKLNTEN